MGSPNDADNNEVDSLLARHRAALDEYRAWDEKVKQLLKGRRVKDLSQGDMDAYREAAEQRDLAYNRMRQYERALLDDIPGASTGPHTSPHRGISG
jgi:hypothetical protein